LVEIRGKNKDGAPVVVWGEVDDVTINVTETDYYNRYKFGNDAQYSFSFKPQKDGKQLTIKIKQRQVSKTATVPLWIHTREGVESARKKAGAPADASYVTSGIGEDTDIIFKWEETVNG
jgi:hypothetical protein